MRDFLFKTRNVLLYALIKNGGAIKNTQNESLQMAKSCNISLHATFLLRSIKSSVISSPMHKKLFT